MQLQEDKAVQGQQQAIVPQAPQPLQATPGTAEQPTEIDEAALQALVQQSRSKRRATRDGGPAQPDQRMEAIQVEDDDTMLHLQGLDRTGLKTVPKQKARATTPDHTKHRLRALQIEIDSEMNALQQEVPSSMNREEIVPAAFGESRAVAAIYEELRLPPRARDTLGAASNGQS
eukprot:4806028-Amphidinium_carterae.1